MAIIRPILFVSSGAGTIEGDGYVVKDFRPTAQDPNLEVKGLVPLPPKVVVELSAEEVEIPKDPASPATGSVSDSDSETSGKSTLGSDPELSQVPNPIPPLVLSAGAASVAKEKTPSTPSTNDGKTKPPAAE